MTIDFEIEVEQSEEQKFTMTMSLEGAFLSEEGVDKKNFQQLVQRIINNCYIKPMPLPLH